MNSQELRALHEAYIQVYDEDYKPWDFGPKQNAQAKHAELAQRKAAGGSAPGTATRANKIASVGREMRTTLDRDSAMTMTTPSKQGLQPSTQRHTAAALRGAGGGTTARTKFDVKPLKPASKGGGSSAQGAGSPSGTGRYTPGGGQGYGISGIKLADSYDLYDIILSHLIDEGYAETLEQAQVIMVNMSEDWRESIIEAVDDTHSGHPNYKGPSQDPLSRANRAIGNAVNFATGQEAAEVRAKQKGVPGNVVVKQSGPFSTKNVPTKGSFISDTEMKRRGQSTKPMGPIGQ